MGTGRGPPTPVRYVEMVQIWESNDGIFHLPALWRGVRGNLYKDG